MDKVSIQDKLYLIKDYWKPIIVGELNNQHVKLVKIKDKFTMHHHENEDEFFLVIKGLLKMDYGDRIIEIKEGNLLLFLEVLNIDQLLTQRFIFFYSSQIQH